MERGKAGWILGAVLVAALVLALSAAASPGSLDSTFGHGGKVLTAFGPGDDEADDVAIQPDGKIVAAGFKCTATGPTCDSALARYNADGSRDRTFGTAGKVVHAFAPHQADWINHIALQPDGKIVVVGYWSNDAGNRSDFFLARFKTNGSLDTSFGAGGWVHTHVGSGAYTNGYGLAVQPDGKIVVGGYGYRKSGKYDTVLVRYRPNGGFDGTFGKNGRVITAFGTATSSLAYRVLVLPDGRIVEVGYEYDYGDNTYSAALARYKSNGAPDPTFGTGGKVLTRFGADHAITRAAELQPDGKIVVAGYILTKTGGGKERFALARYKTNGRLDTTFGAGGKVTTAFGFRAVVSDILIQPNGRIVAAGWNTNQMPPANLLYTFALARYRTNGGLDGTFGSHGKVTTPARGEDDYITGSALQTDGKIVVAGGSEVRDTANFDFVLARYQTK